MGPWIFSGTNSLANGGDLTGGRGLAPLVPAFTDVGQDLGDLLIGVRGFERRH